MQEAGVNSLGALRALPADSILALRGGLSAPYTDGYVLPADVRQVYARGKQNDVPMLMGWNEDDVVFLSQMEKEAFDVMVATRFGGHAEQFHEVYPSSTPEGLQESQESMSRDEAFGVQVYTWAKMQDSTGHSPVYLYNFNRPLPAYSPESAFGAFHSGEIVYAYDNLHTLDRPWEQTDHELAEVMSSYWVNFIRDGNPNGPELPSWKPYTREDEQVLVLDDEVRSETLPTEPQLRFWERYFRDIENL